MQNFHIYIFFSFSPPPPPKRGGASGGGGRRRGSAEGRSPPPTPAAASEHRLGGGGGEKEKKIYIWKFCIYTKMQYSTFTNMLNFFNLKSFYRPWLWKNNPFRGRRSPTKVQKRCFWRSEPIRNKQTWNLTLENDVVFFWATFPMAHQLVFSCFLMLLFNPNIFFQVRRPM